ncbi:MAG: CHAP domain-containing protein [Oscillospiraceae bacterium]|nr:CHAP domain-containing protein [Oscillospiraceae bacterium]
MNSQAAKIIATARGHLGTRESPPHSNNVRFNTAYYGRAVSGPAFPWCVVFVWYVFREAGLSHLFFGGERTASCGALVTFARRHGLFRTSGFESGDLVFFDWSGRRTTAQHMGIITEVRQSAVVSIEGNTSIGNDSDGGEVMERTRSFQSIVGAYRPEYEEDEEVDIDQLRRELTALSGTGNDSSGWATGAVEKLTDMGLFNGDGQGNFGWGQLVTREALAQVLYNLLAALEKRE